MAEEQDKPKPVKLKIKKDDVKETPESKNNAAKKTPVDKKSTMDIKMYSIAGKKFTATGPCTNREIKLVLRALKHTEGQIFEVK